MTTPSSITVSLEWAKKLKEAGWPQDETSFYWIVDNGFENLYFNGPDVYDPKDPACFAAPTAEEILRRLPKSVATKNRKVHRLSISCNGGKRWQIMYGNDIFESPVIVDPDDSLANAAAAMYCYLSDNKLLP